MPQFVNTTALSAGSMGADIASASVDIRDFTYASVGFVWTGTPTGNLSVQVSVDGSHWQALSSTHAAGGASGAWSYDPATPIGYPYIRGFFAFASSTGALTVQVFAKSGA